jgi:lactoylglutathione lyase
MTATVGTANGRLLHTMIRVLDLEKSIDFYTRLLGMKLMRRNDYPSGEFTLAFVGGDGGDNAVIAPPTSRPQEPDLAPSGISRSAPDIYGACEALVGEGSRSRPPGPMKHGGSVIAFIEDPDGCKIELIQRE